MSGVVFVIDQFQASFYHFFCVLKMMYDVCIKPEWHDKVPEPKERTVVIGKDTDHDVSGKHGHRGFLPAGVCVV